MIFITPNTSSSPVETINRIAAVVTISRPRFSIAIASPRLLERRALRARIDVLEGFDHLHRTVRLHLPQIHRKRRVTLLVHLDLAARSVEGNLRERGDHLRGVDGAGFFDGRLVEVD